MKVCTEAGMPERMDASFPLSCVLRAFGQARLVSIPHKLTNRTHGPQSECLLPEMPVLLT